MVLFQYLVDRCRTRAEWIRSDSSLRNELGIKRSRLDGLREKFVSMGILSYRIVQAQRQSKIGAYRLNFTKLTDIQTLQQLYRPYDAEGKPLDLTWHAGLFSTLAAEQPAVVQTHQPSSQEPEKPINIRALATKIEKIFALHWVRHKIKIEQQAKGERLSLLRTLTLPPGS